MSINRITAASLTLLGALALGGVAMAATPPAASAAPGAAVHHVVKHHAVRHLRRGHEMASSAMTMERMHTRVATTRAVQQQRWIASSLQRGRIDLAQPAGMERAQAGILARQAALTGSGHETVQQALAMQHRQDLQDWAIRTDHPWA